MLSNVDIKRALGKQIGIFPFNGENLEGSSIYLTASDLAWSINSKMKAINAEGCIIIEPHDTVAIITVESVCLSSNYAGYCISRVSSGPHGLGAISYPVKPQWIGRLLITLHNSSNIAYRIKKGEGIAVLTLHRLDNNSENSDPKQNSRFELLSEVGIQVSREDIANINQKCYTIDKVLFDYMRTSDSYKEYMRIYSPFWNKKRIAQITTVAIMLAILVALGVVIFNLNNENGRTIVTASFGTVLTYLLIIVKDIIQDIKGD